MHGLKAEINQPAVVGWALMRRPAILTRILITILLLGITPLGPPALGQTSAPTSAQHKSPDVYLITIDTLRADHVGCYGYKQVETPALDTLAADGVRFTQAFTIADHEHSHITILTGLLPACTASRLWRPLSPSM